MTTTHQGAEFAEDSGPFYEGPEDFFPEFRDQFDEMAKNPISIVQLFGSDVVKIWESLADGTPFEPSKYAEVIAEKSEKWTKDNRIWVKEFGQGINNMGIYVHPLSRWEAEEFFDEDEDYHSVLQILPKGLVNYLTKAEITEQSIQRQLIASKIYNLLFQADDEATGNNDNASLTAEQMEENRKSVEAAIEYIPKIQQYLKTYNQKPPIKIESPFLNAAIDIMYDTWVLIANDQNPYALEWFDLFCDASVKHLEQAIDVTPDFHMTAEEYEERRKKDAGMEITQLLHEFVSGLYLPRQQLKDAPNGLYDTYLKVRDAAVFLPAGINDVFSVYKELYFKPSDDREQSTFNLIAVWMINKGTTLEESIYQIRDYLVERYFEFLELSREIEVKLKDFYEDENYRYMIISMERHLVDMFNIFGATWVWELFATDRYRSHENKPSIFSELVAGWLKANSRKPNLNKS